MHCALSIIFLIVYKTNLGTTSREEVGAGKRLELCVFLIMAKGYDNHIRSLQHCALLSCCQNRLLKVSFTDWFMQQMHWPQ